MAAAGEHGRSGRIKLALVVILAACVGAGGSYAYLAQQKPAPKGRERSAATKTEHRAAEPDAAVVYVNMGPFLVNLVSADNTLRYLKADVTLGVKGLKEEKKDHGHGGSASAGPGLPPGDDAIARDAIVRVLSAQSFEQLRRDPAHAQVKKALLDELSQTLRECQPDSVLFTSFTMQ